MIEVQGRGLVQVPKEKTIREDKENYNPKIYLANHQENIQDNIQDHSGDHSGDHHADHLLDNSQDNHKKMKDEREKNNLLIFIHYMNYLSNFFVLYQIILTFFFFIHA